MLMPLHKNVNVQETDGFLPLLLSLLMLSNHDDDDRNVGREMTVFEKKEFTDCVPSESLGSFPVEDLEQLLIQLLRKIEYMYDDDYQDSHANSPVLYCCRQAKRKLREKPHECFSLVYLTFANFRETKAKTLTTK